MHRYGNLKPGEIIIFVVVASEHRKEGFSLFKIFYFIKKKNYF